MKLYHREVCLGVITNVSREGFWMSGEIALLPEAAPYRPFFEFMIDESKGHLDPPFGEELLNPENWYIDENGRRRGIEVPAVHNDNSIEWRWR